MAEKEKKSLLLKREKVKGRRFPLKGIFRWLLLPTTGPLVSDAGLL